MRDYLAVMLGFPTSYEVEGLRHRLSMKQEIIKTQKETIDILDRTVSYLSKK